MIGGCVGANCPNAPLKPKAGLNGPLLPRNNASQDRTVSHETLGLTRASKTIGHLPRWIGVVGVPRFSSSGGHVNQRLKQLMKELGEAINESLADSEQIAEVISKIKGSGYDVFLVLEATIGFNKREETPAKPTLVKSGKSEPEFKMSAQDLKFLRSLRITIDDAA